MGLLRYLHPRSAVARHFYYCRSGSQTFGIRAAAKLAGMRLVLLSIQKNSPIQPLRECGLLGMRRVFGRIVS